jgi:hypothetical protein
MKKFLALVLMLSVAFSVKGVGAYGDYTVITGDSYVLKTPFDLSQQAVMQNMYLISLTPKITVDDAPLDFSLTQPEGIFDNPAASYVIDKRDIVSDIDVYAKASMEGSQVVVEVSVKNGGSNKVKLGVSYTVNGEQDRNFALFSPEGYTKTSSKYVVLLQPDYKGQGLAIISSQPIEPNFVNLLVTKTYILSYSISDLEPGQTFSLQVKYYPFVLKEEGALGYPDDLYCYMSEPLIKTVGSAPTATTSGSTDDKIDAMMDTVRALSKKGGEFSSIHDVDFGAGEFDSLDTSVFFKQLCINNEIPCQLVIGKKDEVYYAWVRAYNGNWMDIDTYANEKTTPEYQTVYVEPKTEVHNMPFSENAEKMIYDGTSWIGSMGQVSFLMYFIIIIVIACGAVVALQFKKVILGKLLAKKGKILESTVEMDGKYEVLNEDIDDPFMKEIIKRIKEKDGIVNVGQLVEVMHFSKELIEDGIAYLVDQKFIRKVM